MDYSGGCCFATTRSHRPGFPPGLAAYRLARRPRPCCRPLTPTAAKHDALREPPGWDGAHSPGGECCATLLSDRVMRGSTYRAQCVGRMADESLQLKAVKLKLDLHPSRTNDILAGVRQQLDLMLMRCVPP